MSLLNALMLGIIQGVAEFLPISSSGHLSIAQNLLGLGVEGTDDVFFDVLLHLGTLAAVFVGDLAYSSVHPNEGKGITDYQKAETEEEGETEDAVLSCAHGRGHYRYVSGRLS